MQAKLFGRFRLFCNSASMVAIEKPKVQELICYLILFRARPHARENIADLMWGDTTSVHARRNLRKTLWQLQSDLGALNDTECAMSEPALFLIDNQWIQLNPQFKLSADVAFFEETFHHMHGKSGATLGKEEARALHRAVDLYIGDLLEGWYQDWCLMERERFQFMYLAMLDRLVQYHEAHQEHEAGIVYATRALQHDRARERTHRQLMRLYHGAGDRTAALYQYQRCVEVLNSDLNVPPDTRTTALYEQIRDAQSPQFALGIQSASTEAPSALDRLQLLETLLRQAHQEIAQLRRDLRVNMQK